MENSEKRSSSNKKRNISVTILVLLILAIIGVIVFIIINLGEKTTVTTADEDTIISTDALTCTSTSKTAGSFFNIADALNVNQKFTVTFKNDSISAIMYDLDAEYASETLANQKIADLRGVYDKYVNNQTTSSEKLAETFAYNNTDVKISIYATRKAITEKTGGVFLLDSDGYNMKDLATYYADKGYKCDYKN